MNILNFNNGVSGEMFDRCGVKKSTALAPVFYGKEPSTGDFIEAKEILTTGKRILPFPQIRIWMDPNEVQKAEGIGSYRVYCEEWAETDWRIMRIGFTIKGTPDHIAFVHSRYDKEKNHWVEHYEAWSGRRGLTGMWADESDLDDEMIDWIAGETAAVICFLWEISSPANFVASVRPQKQGKSVEWMACRTHYVVLHKSHPANKTYVASGEEVQEDARYVKRQAHSRRAHYRILKSPMFRHKLGQRVWVRSTWVGPKEWQQASSIYRLYEPAAA